jgi:hypothetical protein
VGESEQEALRNLEVEKRELESEKSLMNEQTTVLSEYKKSLKAEHVPPQEMKTILDGFLDQGKGFIKGLSALEKIISGLDNELKAERARLATRKGRKGAKVEAVILAQRDGPLKLVLSYSMF